MQVMNHQIQLHPEEGRAVSPHRNLHFELVAIVALALISTAAAYTVLGSADSVNTQTELMGMAAYIR